MSVVRGLGRGGNLKIDYRKDLSVAEYVPLPPNPETPNPVIPITGAGDMFKAVYDTDNDGVVDNVETVEMSQVVGLQQTITDILNNGGGGGGANPQFIYVLNNGGDSIYPGQPICKSNDLFRAGNSLEPRQRIIGLAADYSSPGTQLKIQTAGLMSYPPIAWDIATDSVGGLANGLGYYVDSAGKLTTQAPENSPEFLIKVGIALNNTDLLIDLDLAIKL